MPIFYKSIYLIINPLLNTVIRICSEIPFRIYSGGIETMEMICER